MDITKPHRAWMDAKQKHAAFIKKFNVKFSEGLGRAVDKLGPLLKGEKFSDAVIQARTARQITAKYLRMLEALPRIT